MLHAQFLDYPSGRVGVMASPPRFVHFNGTIVTYRDFRNRAGRTVSDELFRVLLLAVLEDLIPDRDGGSVVPPVEELSQGLADPRAPVTYLSESAARISRSSVRWSTRCARPRSSRATGPTGSATCCGRSTSTSRGSPTLGTVTMPRAR